jgi:hypothetical protein
MEPEGEEFRLEAENSDLRLLLAKAGIDAAEQEVARKLQRVLLEELHHRVKNILATVQAITSFSLRAAQCVSRSMRRSTTAASTFCLRGQRRTARL